MRLTTVEQLRNHLVACARNAEFSTIYIGSRTFGNTELKIPVHNCTVATETLHSSDYTGIFWCEGGGLRSRSCLDMNIPENGYNDYRAFTTREEMEAYTR